MDEKVINVQEKDASMNDYVNYKIEVNKTSNKLYLYVNGKVKQSYTVSTGVPAKGYETPEGTFPMVVKIVYPGWRGIPGGDPKNPLGPRWLGLEVNKDKGRTFGIHGNNNGDSIGRSTTNGCIRLYNSDVLKLYKVVPEGTPIWIHKGTSNNTWRGDKSIGLKPLTGLGTITGNNVNFRTGPSLGSFVIRRLNNGLRIKKIGICGKWYKVSLRNEKGFIYKDFIR